MKELLKRIIDLLILINQILSARAALMPLPVEEEVWLDSHDVKNIFNIAERTLYRRRVNGDFVARKIGGKWFFLKSSVQKHFE